MKTNAGVNERVIRVFIGLIILSYGLIIESYVAVFGIWLILSGVTGISLLYGVFGISTDRYLK